MVKVIRARYEGGVLKPLGRLDLREGEEVIVSIEERAAHGLVELVESLRRETPKVDEPVKVLEEIRKW
jgi:predicted DNA-binding antitoxin AbrB/MazE fold protein